MAAAIDKAFPLGSLVRLKERASPESSLRYVVIGRRSRSHYVYAMIISGTPVASWRRIGHVEQFGLLSTRWYEVVPEGES